MDMNLVAATVIVAALWSVLCRIDKMKHGVTRFPVFLQHAALAMGLAAGLLIAPPYDKIAMGVGVLVFLLLGSSRWRFDAPRGTEKPRKLSPYEQNSAAGGKK